MQFYTKPKHPPAINIVSLIDILCILLIFFVATSEFKEEQPLVQIQLPESTQGTQEERPPELIIILVTKDKKIFIGNTEITLDRLKTSLKERQAGPGNAHFELKADTDVPMGFFIKVLDASKEAGIANLSIQTQDATK